MDDNIYSIVNIAIVVSKGEIKKLEILSKYFSKDIQGLNNETNIKVLEFDHYVDLLGMRKHQ